MGGMRGLVCELNLLSFFKKESGIGRYRSSMLMLINGAAKRLPWLRLEFWVSCSFFSSWFASLRLSLVSSSCHTVVVLVTMENGE